MIKTLKLAVLFLTVVGVSTMVIPAYSLEKAEQQATTSISGEVASVDLVKSTVTINQLKDAATNTYEKIVILVAPDTKILKGDVALKLSELKSGDNIKAESTSDASGKSKVTSIIVEVKKEAAPIK